MQALISRVLNDNLEEYNSSNQILDLILMSHQFKCYKF